MTVKKDTVVSSVVNLLLLDHRPDQKAIIEEAYAKDVPKRHETIDNQIDEEVEDSSSKSLRIGQNLHSVKRPVLDLLKTPEKVGAVEKEGVTLKSQVDRTAVRDDILARKSPSENLPSLSVQLVGRKQSSSLLTAPKLMSRSSNRGDVDSSAMLEDSKFLEHDDDDAKSQTNAVSSLRYIDGEVKSRQNKDHAGLSSTDPALGLSLIRNDQSRNDEKSEVNKVRENPIHPAKMCRRNRNGRLFKKRPDPTDELNRKSAIQVNISRVALMPH